MKEPKVGDELIVRCGRTRTLRKGMVRALADRWSLPVDAESFSLTDELIVVLGKAMPESRRDDKVTLRGEPVLNTDYSVVYLPELKEVGKKKKKKRKRR